MQELSKEPTDFEIETAIDAWVRDLAAANYSSAIERTAHDPHYGWTPELLRSVIEGYGLPEPHERGPFQVTDPTQASGAKRLLIDRDDLPDKWIASVSYDLPLNGSWSDLTATFRIERSESGSVMVLEDVHVF